MDSPTGQNQITPILTTYYDSLESFALMMKQT
jgi:hypothetical protein